MPATLEELQARLDALRAQRASGVDRARLADGREVAYKTDAQMAAAIADLERQIEAAAGDSITRHVHVGMSRGVE